MQAEEGRTPQSVTRVGSGVGRTQETRPPRPLGEQGQCPVCGTLTTAATGALTVCRAVPIVLLCDPFIRHPDSQVFRSHFADEVTGAQEGGTVSSAHAATRQQSPDPSPGPSDPQAHPSATAPPFPLAEAPVPFRNRVCFRLERSVCSGLYGDVQSVQNTSVPGTAPGAFHRGLTQSLQSLQGGDYSEPLLQMRKRRLREVTSLAPGQAAVSSHGQEPERVPQLRNPGLLPLLRPSAGPQNSQQDREHPFTETRVDFHVRQTCPHVLAPGLSPSTQASTWVSTRVNPLEMPRRF